MEQLILGWAIESNFEYDYIMWGIEQPIPLHTFEIKKIQYNQSKNDPRGCTWYAVMTCIANNWSIVWTDEDFKYMRENASRYGYVSWEWMYLSKAGDMVVDYLNIKYPTQWRIKKPIDIVDEWMYYMDMWYMLHMGSKINKTYTNDILDWLISKARGKEWTGHSRSTSNIQVRTSIVENYYWWLPFNVIDLRDWVEINKSNQFYRQAFIYYPTNKMPVVLPPHMTIEQANELEKKYHDLFTNEFSESVRAWIDEASKGMKLHFEKYLGIDWVMKMMNDLLIYRSK